MRAQPTNMSAMAPKEPIAMPAMAPGVRLDKVDCTAADTSPPGLCKVGPVGPPDPPVLPEGAELGAVELVWGLLPDPPRVLVATGTLNPSSRMISLSVVCHRMDMPFAYTGMVS
jgi:hypothetical protein